MSSHIYVYSTYVCVMSALFHMRGMHPKFISYVTSTSSQMAPRATTTWPPAHVRLKPESQQVQDVCPHEHEPFPFLISAESDLSHS